MSDKERMEAGNVTLLPSHWNSINKFAAEQSYSSTSAALRRIIDEWLVLTGKVRKVRDMPDYQS